MQFICNLLFFKRRPCQALASTIAGQGSLVHQFVISVSMRYLKLLFLMIAVTLKVTTDCTIDSPS